MRVVRVCSRLWNASRKKLTEESRGLEEVGGALLVLGVAGVANDKVHREDLGIEREIVVQLGREKPLVSLASAEALVLDVIDDDGGVMVDLVKDRFVKLHYVDVDYYKNCGQLHASFKRCLLRRMEAVD